MTTAIETLELTKHYGELVAVDHLTLQVQRGEVFAFLGPNGSGKTTTIRMLCGIITPSSGEGHVLGFDITSQSEAIKANIGYMSQRFALYEDLTVRENLDFYAGIYRVPRARRSTRVNELIVLVAAFPPRRHPRRASICQPAILAHTGQFADDQLTQFSVLHFERIGSCC